MPTSGTNSGLKARPSNGNSTKVQENTSKCRRQCPAPAMIASRDSLAPCRKNSRPMARLVSQPKYTAPSPEQGSTVAISTTPSKARVKLSNNMRKYFITVSVLSLCKGRR
ncbi:hypothetical protein D3C75_937820 [compost metagenome]